MSKFNPLLVLQSADHNTCWYAHSIGELSNGGFVEIRNAYEFKPLGLSVE